MCDRRHLQKRERDELKQVIRSIIESNGNKMTIRSLLRDYKELNGSDLPFARFGYESLLELIREMDDTFGVEIRDQHRYESDYAVYCLPNDSTKHIVDFVQNQKHADEQHMEVLHPVLNLGHKNKSYNNPRLKITKPFQLKPNLNLEENDGIDFDQCMNTMPSLCQSLRGANRHNHIPVRKAVCPLPDSRFITNDEKNNIHQLMTRFTSINLLNFAVIYSIFHKKAIDFKRFGFDSLDQFLRQIPDLVRLVPSSDGIKVVTTLRNGTKPNALPNGLTDGLPNGLKNCLTNDLTKSNGLKQNHFIPSKDLKEIQSILRKNPNGIPVFQFLDDYFKTFRKPFVSNFWGYGSPIEMFADLKDIFYLEKPAIYKPMEEWILRETTPELRAQTLTTVPIRKKFDQQFKDNVNELMRKLQGKTQSKELSVEEFADAYYICFDQKIDPKIYGFNDFKQLLMNLSKECEFDVKERIKSKPFVVFNKKFYD